MKGLYYNDDETQIFWMRDFPAGKAAEVIDRWVAVLANAGVSVYLCNTNSRRTNYRSDVWDAYWDGYDPNGPDEQPFLAPIPQNEVAEYRRGIDRMYRTYKEGIDYPAVVMQSCRRHGMSPWITLRMNDCHYNHVPDHPFHGSFWRKNPQFYRKNATGHFATCLDYAHPEVRDFYRALIVETLDRFDSDGLELDFMREPHLFSAGEEQTGAAILTAWLREIRTLVDQAAAQRGHPVRLGVRVPSRPEVALAWGLDAKTWSQEGLIDLLVATPRWATLEFDMPMEQWREMLLGTEVTLAGGLEIRYQPRIDGPAYCISPDLARGAAAGVLSRGADAVYLFNYFQDTPGWDSTIYRDTFKAMASLGSLRKLSRAVGITYRDITAPEEDYRQPLPAQGRALTFHLRLTPPPDPQWVCEALIGLSPSGDAKLPAPVVAVNGKPGEVLSDTMDKSGVRLVTFTVPVSALGKTGACEIRVTSANGSSLTVERVEIAARKPGDIKAGAGQAPVGL